MTSILESISRFTSTVSDSINHTFKDISDFLDLVVTFFTTMGFWFSVIVFFLIFITILIAPLYIVKYYDTISEKYKALVKRFVKST